MDFALLPPEINSGRMYAGPGAIPLLAAAEAWEGVATELHIAADSSQSVISGLTAGPWLGPSSMSMTTAALRHSAWLTNTAVQAEQTATQAKAAAAAYQAAFAATVPPSVITANRSQLMTLVATNRFGQNTAAIAATEAQYAEMWAQDATAMYAYAGSSAIATALTPFTPPQQNTNPGGLASQAAAAAVPAALQRLALAAPAAAATPSGALTTLANLITIFIDLPSAVATLLVDTPLAPLAAVALPYDIVGALTGLHTDEIVSGWAGVEGWPGKGTQPPTTFPATITNLGSAPASASAGVGEANTVGALSVPATWTIATPAVRPISVTLPALPAASVAAPAGENLALGSGSMFSEMALAGMAGTAMTGALGVGGRRHGANAGSVKHRAAARAGAAPTTGGAAPSNSDSAAVDATGTAPSSEPRTVVTGVAAELREFAKLRDEGILTDAEFTEQKNRLLGR